MTSKDMDGTTENSSLTLQGLNIDDKLQHVSCPFTWALKAGTATPNNYGKTLKKREERYQIALDRQDYFPELVLIYCLMAAFEDVTCDDIPSAMEYMSKAEACFADIKQKAKLQNVENVLEHIVIGTKCHLLKLQGRLTEVDELLNGICNIRDMTETERAMLSGCISSACSLYTVESSTGITSAREAIKHEPSNGKWHYLLGHNCRALRRLHRAIGKPNAEEISAFEKAYELLPDEFFGVSLAQLYRESGDYDRANEIYKKVHALQPTCCTLRLQLALGFIRAQEKRLAKECLDHVAKEMPNICRFTHYMAIYEEKCNRDFEAALPYYKRTTDEFNWTAEMQYLNCLKKVKQDWDPLPHMLNLLKKYEGYVCSIIQEMNIQIGSHYLFKLGDIPSACKHLLEAIQIDPNTNKIKDDYVPSCEAQIVLRKVAAMKNDEQNPILNNTLELCRRCCTNLPTNSASSLGQNRNSQSRSRWPKNGQSFAPRRGAVAGTASSSSQSQGFPKNHS